MGDIKIFVCCHRPFPVPRVPMLVPIQVGAALAEEHFPGYVHDDTGDHISEKNRSYCELTALYWAWKNQEADYYGLWHYRRYLYPDLGAKLPYAIEKEPTEALLERLGYGGFEALIRGHDLIVPMGEDMRVTVRDHYHNAPFHHKKDLDLVERIILEKTPEYGPAMERYLSGTVCYFGNICVMRQPVFRDYCRWLFSILEEFDARADVSGYGVQDARVNGFLAERLLGVYVTHVREGLRVAELPRVHFLPDDRQRNSTKRAMALLPPGSRRRALVKATVRKVKACLGRS